MSNSDKAMPPKKSKAARKTEHSVEDEEAPHQNGTGDDAMDVGGGGEEGEGGLVKEGNVNIFKDDVILEGKRKRNVPMAEQTLLDWLKKNFVEKENSYLSLADMYEVYLESCSSMATFAVDFVQFQKSVNQLFPKGLALVENSAYKDAVREKKPPKKKITTKIQADSLHLKMKDIIKEAIADLGNPRKGLGFSVVKNLVASKFPALRIEMRVKFFKNAVQKELRFGHIECVRGVGACGYYRLPRTTEQEAEEIEAEKKEAKEKAQKKKDKKNASPAAAASDEKTDDNAEHVTSGDESQKAEDKTKTDVEKKEEEGEGEQKDSKKKKKKKKNKKPKRDDFVMHGEPMRIEDTFALAMTYNSEPKEASVAKIRKYIKDFYKEEMSIERLKKCLDTGVEHGFWFQVSGHGSGSGSFRLTINEFDPVADDDLTGKMMNAIVACTEPKQSSALLLKKYVQDYHPNFRVAERPHLFKLALQRAVAKNKIVQLSGIGATGTFQLIESFLPSPTVLQGNDTTSDYEVSDNEGKATEVEDYKDAYKPRPTKRRGAGRPDATTFSRLDPSVSNPRQTMSKGKKQKKKKTTGRGGGGGRRIIDVHSDTSDEESEEEKEMPRKGKTPTKRKATTSHQATPAKKAKGKKTVVKGKKQTPSAAKAAPPSESESEEYDSEPEEYTPRKSLSRGGGGGKTKVVKPIVLKPTASGKGWKKGSGGKIKVEEEDEEEEEEEEEESKSKTRKTKGKKRKEEEDDESRSILKTSARDKRRSGKVSYNKDDGEEEETPVRNAKEKSKVESGAKKSQGKGKRKAEEEEEPVKRNVRGSAARAAKMQAQPPSDESDDDDEEQKPVKGRPAKKRSTLSASASKRKNMSSSEEDDDDDEEATKGKKKVVAKSKPKKKKRGKKSRY